MNKPRILVATDFSDHAELALEQARAYARMANLSLLIVHVVQTPSPSAGEGMLHDGAYADDTATLGRRLEVAANTIDGVAGETRLLKGDPAKEILRVAENEDIAMIVMGTHGRSGIKRALMGSVAEQVVRAAPCNVLVVKRPRD
jgi:nucleotide-binding universal stress UspA family protein